MPELPARRHVRLRTDPVDGLRVDGAWAAYTVAQAAGLTRVPDNVAMEQAYQNVDMIMQPGQRGRTALSAATKKLDRTPDTRSRPRFDEK